MAITIGTMAAAMYMPAGLCEPLCASAGFFCPKPLAADDVGLGVLPVIWVGEVGSPAFSEYGSSEPAVVVEVCIVECIACIHDFIPSLSVGAGPEGKEGVGPAMFSGSVVIELKGSPVCCEARALVKLSSQSSDSQSSSSSLSRASRRIR
jgi:hypothetical protein